MKNRKGFTLIELIMVIVILGILAAVAIPKFVNLSATAAKSACEGIRGNIASAAAIYYAQDASKGKTSPKFPLDSTAMASCMEGWGSTFKSACPGGNSETISYVPSSGTATCSNTSHT